MKLYTYHDEVLHTYSFYNSSNVSHNWTYDLCEESNVYYHVNRIHDFFKSSPFSFDNMDYQMKAYIVNSDSINGQATGFDIKFGTMDNQYWSRSSDCIYHEYTHNVIYHLYGNNWIGTGWYTQSGAMNEGFPDYFACSLNDDNLQPKFPFKIN